MDIEMTLSGELLRALLAVEFLVTLCWLDGLPWKYHFAELFVRRFERILLLAQVGVDHVLVQTRPALKLQEAFMAFESRCFEANR